jgi:S-formylglutathione hydrolase FrmB
MLRRAAALTAVAGLVALAVGATVLALSLGTDQHGARVIHFTIRSRFVHQTLPETEVIPPGTTGRGRPLLVFLHGRGVNGQDSNLSSEMFKALDDQSANAPDVVFPNGGVASYWHNRSSGGWADYITHEVIPQALHLVGADPHRVAIGGISMGGFGALDIARLNPGRFCAIGAHSAALWFQGADSASGAFDDAEDFGRHDLIRIAAQSNPYRQAPIWLDVGTGDPFRNADTALARELRADGANINFSVSAGGHDGAYWGAHLGAYLRFYARALRGCGR